MQFVGGDGFLICGRVGFDELWITLQPWKFGNTNQDTAEGDLVSDDGIEIERGGIPVLLEEDLGGIDSDEVASIPWAVIVALTGISFLMPVHEVIVEHEDQFEMKMGSFAGDGLTGVCGAAHDTDGITGLDGLAGAEIFANGREMGIERKDFPTLHLVAQDHINAVIGQGRFFVQVSHRPVGRGINRIDGFPAVIALNTADVDAFMHLPAFGSDAAEGPAGPGSADGADEIFFFCARFEQRLVRGGQDEMADVRWRRLGFRKCLNYGEDIPIGCTAASTRKEVKQQKERQEVLRNEVRASHSAGTMATVVRECNG